MAVPRGRSPPRTRHRHSRSVEDDEAMLSSRQLEAFGRTVHATASQLIGLPTTGEVNQHYQAAIGEIHRELRRPLIQRSVWSLAKTNPRELVRSTLNTTEIQHRALTHLPDELLRHVPESNATYSLFQGFQASLPEEDAKKKKRHSRHNSKGQKLIDTHQSPDSSPTANHGLDQVKDQKHKLDHRLEMMGVRKNMCVSEIREIDTKIANLNTMRKIVLDRLAGLESEEADLEHDITEVSNKLEDLQEELEDAAALAQKSPTIGVSRPSTSSDAPFTEEPDTPGFMSESIYDKLPMQKTSPVKKRKSRPNRRISMPVLHEHLAPGSRIREFQAHTDMVTALDFDQPFGTLVTSAMDDTVRVWDLNAARCLGMLEGHLSSVRCLQVVDNLVATGSMDASIKLWDLSQAEYTPPPTSSAALRHVPQPFDEDEEDGEGNGEPSALFASSDEAPIAAAAPPAANLSECEVFTLSAHVAEVTALHMHNNTLVSGSADKTLRQWDLEKGRCVQTLDVLWAAAQVNTLSAPSDTAGAGGWFQPMAGAARGRTLDPEADFVGAVQVFDAALACGTADGMVRLWDLRSGTVSRSLVGHTGPVTALQFDDVHLVTGSADRSVRIWDLRTGTLYDAFAYDSPILSMQFDTRHIISAIGDPVVKVFDKAEGRHWDCGAGAVAAQELEQMVDEEDRVRGLGTALSAVERVRVKEGYMVEGRRDGVVGVWSC
ncbi:hypothetical protein AAFC00_003499 [Neodothiora populina]|uniref:Mitochondrial division protein 1 n=1 Tax=Neodothiora populina TaxID=2781224 RepID=A0ABR3PED3_9PEZI